MGCVVSGIKTAAEAVWKGVLWLARGVVKAVVKVIDSVKSVVQNWLGKPEVYKPLQKETQPTQELVMHKKSKKELEKEIEKKEKSNPEAAAASERFLQRFG